MTTNITSEKHVKAQVKKLLDKHGWFWWMPPANGFGKGGISDFNAIKNGVVLAIETKFGTNKPTPLQIGFCRSIQSEKGFAFCVNERNLTWLDAWLQSFSNATAGVAAYAGPDKEQGVDPADGATLLNALAVLTEFL